MATVIRTTPEHERERAFGDDFDRLYALALGAARRRGFGIHDAHDIAQETMARCYAHWHRIADAPHLEAWVQRVAANLAVDFARRQSRRLPEPAGDLTDHAAGPDRVVLQQALNQLPRRQREVIELRYLSDLPEQEVAAVLKCSVGTVRKSSDRGRARLAELLGDVHLERFRAPAADAASAPRTAHHEVAQRGRQIRSARRAIRTLGVVVVVACAAIGGWFATRERTSPPPVANTSTTSTTVLNPTVSTDAPVTLGNRVPAEAASPDPSPAVNLDLLRNIDRYFAVDAVRSSAPYFGTSAFRVTVTNVSGRAIAPEEFGDAKCHLFVGSSNGANSEFSLPARDGLCRDVMGGLAPGESTAGETTYTTVDPFFGRLDLWYQIGPESGLSTGQIIGPPNAAF